MLLTSSEDSEAVLSVGLPYTVEAARVPGPGQTVRLDPGLDHVQVDDGLPGEQPSNPPGQEDLGGVVLPLLRPPGPVQADLVGDEVDGVSLDVPGCLGDQAFVAALQPALPVDGVETVPGLLSAWKSTFPQAHRPHVTFHGLQPDLDQVHGDSQAELGGPGHGARHQDVAVGGGTVGAGDDGQALHVDSEQERVDGSDRVYWV